YRLYQDYQKRTWNYSSNLIVLDSEKLTVSIYPFTRGTIKVVYVPKDALVTVPGGYGQYQLKHVLALSKSEKKDEELLVKAITDILGIPIDATTKSLTLWDTLLIRRAMGEDVDTQILNLDDLPIFVSETRADGILVQRIDPVKVDFYLKDLFWEANIKAENLTVGIFNASGEVGIASRTMRTLEHIGVRVVEVSNWEEVLSRCELRTHPSFQQSATFHRIQQHFNCVVREEITSNRYDMQMLVVN
ncbi:LCP family protein, partial [Candidatus Roizmanbacteria bacterium]|nr:LCP family protein [Candidatus Roizmanbacteria bacterium]